MKEGYMLPEIRTEIPGPLSRKWMYISRRYEPPGITYMDKDFPVFIEKAYLNNVWDIDGNRYVDLTAFFGVSILGHRHPAIQEVIENAELYHGMGDVHPSKSKIELIQKLNEYLEDKYMGIFAQSGSEAVETCLKTQLLYTKRPGIIVFEDAYHGLGMGAFNLTHWEKFKEGLREYLRLSVYTLPFPDDPIKEKEVLEDIKKLVENEPIGLIFLEPIQGRGGIKIFSLEFLRRVKEIAEQKEVLIGYDEIFCGMFRTGYLSYSYAHGLEPDLITLGKGLSSQFPLSICLGKREIMKQAWEETEGEAKHTYTFLGHPLFTKIGLKVLEIIEKGKLDKRVKELGEKFLNYLRSELKNKQEIRRIRGIGLMIGIEFNKPVFPIVKNLLKKGFITLPAGKYGNILEITPPFIITEELFEAFVKVLYGLVK